MLDTSRNERGSTTQWCEIISLKTLHILGSR